MREQELIWAEGGYEGIDRWLEEKGVKRVLLVCDSSLPYLRVGGYFDGLDRQGDVKLTRFSRFRPNPAYESVAECVEQFRQERCEGIIAVGGGSAMDVAKCVKLYAGMDPGKNYLEQAIEENDIPLLAAPTTAGTGSEATRYAVIYYKGEKQSVTHESCIPDTVLMDPSALETLPEYQKKAAAMDAFCHALESFWSVNSTDKSKSYSREALRLLLEHLGRYLDGDRRANRGMLEAAHLAGKAINITETTAGHAMCYKLTSLYGLAHGHAAGLCVAALWPYMLEHTERCADPRGKWYLQDTMKKLGEAMGCKTAAEGAERFAKIVSGLELERPRGDRKALELLCGSVNPVRLKNHPIALDREALFGLYESILKE